MATTPRPARARWGCWSSRYANTSSGPGSTPNPLTGLDAAGLVERAGGEQVWCETVAHDRSLLITRRVVRRALQPEVPLDIYRPWFT